MTLGVRRSVIRSIGGPLAMAALVLSGCGGDADGGQTGAWSETLSVYATTGHLADLVANVAPEAQVTTMVGPGGDPHVYQPSTRDIQAMRSADLVLWNGLHLEAQMLDQLESFGDRQLAVADRLPTDLLLPWPETGTDGQPLYDPHVWNSPQLWSMVVLDVADELAGLDPERAQTYRDNAAAYVERIEEATDEAIELLEDVPPERRVLVTGHDAFAYFGQTFGFEVYATDVISTEAQLSPVEISALADLIATGEVPVVFHDNQANPQAIASLQEAVRSRGWEVEIATEELYADSLGSEPGVDTYLGVFGHNARAVANGLGGAP